jgi:perosamine synthetase
MRRIGRLESKYVKQVLKSEFRSSKATNMVYKAEKNFSNYVGSKFAIGFVNGTATLHTALEALGIKSGDEVIVPPLTMAATCFAVLQANATPIFADVDTETWQISPESVKKKITNKTKAVISVALYGGSPDYINLKNSIGDIPLIEDNAEAIGTTYQGQSIGNFGEFSSYSFQSSKHLTAGEGGMLCTNSLELADRARKIQSLGYKGVSSNQGKILKSEIQNPNYQRHEILGWNYRMSEIVAALVLGQTQRANSLVNIRKKAAFEISYIIKNCDWLKPQGIYPNSTHSYWAYPVLLQRNDITWELFVEKFKFFGGKGIYAAWLLNYNEPLFTNSNLLNRDEFIIPEIFKEYKKGNCPNAEYLQPKILAFRTNEWSKKSLQVQCSALNQTIKYFGK